MNAVELLKGDHQKVSDLFERVKATEDAKKHARLFEQIQNELDTHSHIEETILYPALKEHEELKDITLEAYEEHKQIKTLIREIERLADGSERFDAKLKVLGENVEHHVEEEENEMFPKIQRLFSNEELDQMGRELEAAKKGLGKKPRAHSTSV